MPQHELPRHPLRHGPRRASRLLRATAAVALLCMGEPAAAANLLRGSANPGAPPGGAPAGAATPGPVAPAAQASQAALRSTQGPLRRALEAVERYRAAQEAARAAALLQPGAVPDGLGVGGLQLAAGVGQDPALWQGAALPVTADGAGGRTEVTVVQDQSRAVLTWETFNVGAQTDLVFDQSAGGQSASSWVVLNRVVDPLARPSAVLGHIRAPGQVYLVNRNGIVFGGGAQVNVGTLLASGLDYAGAQGAGADPFAARDALFRAGLAQGTTSHAGIFEGGGGGVTVEAGARLEAGPLGQLLLFGSGAAGVTNRGELVVTDGQVLLAAADAIALKRGLDGRGYELPLLTAGGLVVNEGLLSARRGNLTLSGGEVHQDGLLTATTGGKASGSIRLAAEGLVELGEGSTTQVLPDLAEPGEAPQTVIGVLDLGVDPVTRLDSRSLIQLSGRSLDLLAGATVYAPAGRVELLAALPAADVAARSADADAGRPPALPDDTRIDLAEGATIDVSGLRGVEVDMAQNSVQGELRAAELRDNPLLRDGPLRSRSVWFDPRLGVEVADLSGYAGLIGRDVTELMTRGGEVVLAADAIVARQGSTIDLSGGSLRYLDGYTRGTVLVDATGRRVAIEDAQPGVRYVGLDGDHVVDHDRWGVTETYASAFNRARPRFEEGYEQGAAAGTLRVTTADSMTALDPAQLNDAPLDPAPRGEAAVGSFRVFDGEVLATTVRGPRQAADPRGASLVFDRAGDVTIRAGGPLLGPGSGPGAPLDEALRHQHALPAGWFDGTFSDVQLTSGFWDNGYSATTGDANFAPGGLLVVPEGVVVDLGPRGTFAFSGQGAEIAGTIRAAGGAVSIRTLELPGSAPGEAPRSYATLAPGELPTTHLAATGVIDVAGGFTNQALDGAGAAAAPVDGGTVSLVATNLLLDAGSRVDVSGGALLDATGARLDRGDAGAITLDVTRPYRSSVNAALQLEPLQGRLILEGELAGWALGAGGSLTIATPYDITIAEGAPAGAAASDRLFSAAFGQGGTAGWLPADFFTRGGFSALALLGERGITVASGTALSPATEALVVPERLAELASGTRLALVAPRAVLPEALRRPMRLTLSTVPLRGLPPVSGAPRPGHGDLVVETGASLRLDPGSAVTLSATGTLFVDGTVEAAGGILRLEGVDALRNANGSIASIGPASVRLGAHARLLAPGWLQRVEDGALQVRSVQPGGQVLLSGDEVLVDAGAVIDVSGVAGIADLPAAGAAGLQREGLAAVPVDGAAGSISVSAASGVVAGQLDLSAGGPAGAGGTLVISADAARAAVDALVVVQAAPAGAPPVGLEEPPPHGAGAPLLVVADAIAASGADAVELRSPKLAPILFDGEVTLQARRSLVLASPVIGGLPGGEAPAVLLEAGYVQLSGTSTAPLAAPSLAEAASGTLTVRADAIDVMGSVSLGCAAPCQALGFATTHLGSPTTTDLRLSDHDAAGRFAAQPGLASRGAIELEAAQVYVGSRRAGEIDLGERDPADPGFLLRSEVSITIQGNGLPAPVPLSFGERLTLRAPVIEQGGVLRAPQGQLRLEGVGPGGAPGVVTLLPGSVTSASLGGAYVPFDALGSDGTFPGYQEPGEAPAKAILLDAATVRVMEGAVVDVSGGGDVLGYTFLPGNGGSRDVLAGGGWAILPGVGSGLAPLGGAGPFLDASLAAGEAVHLEGIPGLADGWYTLLPAHYALLPGGLLLQPAGGTLAGPGASAVRDDGALLVTGRHGYRVAGGGFVESPTTTRFAVMPRQVFGQYSELELRSLSGSALALAADAGRAVRTPLDAGAVALRAGQVTLAGEGRFGAGPGGLSGNLDVAADRIAVVGAGGEAPAGALVLDPRALEAFGAGSLLLGGLRTEAPEGTRLEVTAGSVLVDTAGGPAWTGGELLLAATGSITVADGTRLAADGAAPAGQGPLLLEGDGALLRVSAAGRVAVLRHGAAGATGELRLGAGASLVAAGAITLDASRDVGLAADVIMETPQLDLSSSRINLGDAPTGTAGSTLTALALERLAASSDLLLRAGEIDLYGGLTLGGAGPDGQPTLGRLTLDAALLQGRGGAASIEAGSLVLQNGGGPAAPGAAGGGTLTLALGQLTVGPGEVRVDGFGAVTGHVGLLLGEGHGALDTPAQVSLEVDLMAGASGADTTLRAGGSLALRQGAAAAAEAAGSLGARLSLEADAVLLDTAVTLPAGTLQATARAGALELGASAAVDVSGRRVDFGGVARVAPAGTIALSAGGDLTIAPGAALDVSGTERGGDAGAIALVAGGAATLEGGWVASHGGGRFSVDAERLTGGFEALDAGLEQAGGFDEARHYHLRGAQQELALAEGRTLTAHDVVLESAAGRVTVAGTIDASGSDQRPGGGRIVLSGGDGLVLAGTARLDATAAAAAPGALAPASGEVTLEATGGRVDAAAGAVIEVGGGREGGGAVVIRAPREGAEVAVDRLGMRVDGARELTLQGVARHDAEVVDAARWLQASAEAAAWLQGAAAVASRLRLAGLEVGAGVRFRSAGDLSVASDLVLAGALGRGFLGLEAGRDLLLGASVSDGFAEGAALDRGAALGAGPSATLALSAGRDLVVGAGVVVRTGTGDLELSAGRDVTLLRGAGGGTAPAVIYTAGRDVGAAPGFLGAPGAMPLGAFPVEGGDVRVSAGRDVAYRASATDPTPALPSQPTSAWLYRYGDTRWAGGGDATVRQQTSWSVVFGSFEQGVGALGGGDVEVVAGRDVVQLQVALPTTGQLVTAPGAVAGVDDLVVRGGGDLRLQAGGEVLGGLFVLGRGQASLRAGGSVAPGASAFLQGGAARRPVAALFGLMDATATVVAGGDVAVEGVFDPMLQAQVAANLQGGARGTGAAFWGYGERTALDVTAVGGSVSYLNDPWASVELAGPLNGGTPAHQAVPTPTLSDLGRWFARSPGTLRLASLEGSVSLSDPALAGLTLASASGGGLELLARQDVVLALKSLGMDAVAQDWRRDAERAFATVANASAVELRPASGWRSDASSNFLRGFGAPLHAGDPAPSRLVALEGSVCAYQTGACVRDRSVTAAAAAVSLAEPLLVQAGRDVLSGAWQVQHDDALDVTILRAGRDVYDVALTVSGEGLAVVEAGRDVQQHLQPGVTPPPITGPLGGRLLSVGNASNPALAAGRAADLLVVAGARDLRYEALAAAYLDPANAADVPRTYLGALRTWLGGLGLEVPADDAALRAAFEALPAPLRQAFLLDGVLFPELRASGIEYNDPESRRFHSYDRGRRALALLVPRPDDPALRGDILLDGKPVETQAQGNVTLLAPHGRVAIGSEGNDTSSDGGVVTRRGGDVQILAQGNVDLFTSRVFTLQGGNVLIWSDGGDITAGAGAKTAVRDVPFRYAMNNDGVVTLDVFGLQTGAGIGVLDALRDGAAPGTPSRLDLVAPTGEVNAGDAGIRSVGDLNIAAQVVVGAENIQVGGRASGVPRVEVPSMTALTSAAQVTSAAASEGVGPDPQAAQRTLAQLPSIITVEVLGYETPEGEPDPKSRKGRKEGAPAGR